MKKTILVSTLMVSALSSGLCANDSLKACLSCHGEHFEKHALGKSKIVQNMNEKEIAKALNGYKDGTYGGPMKGIMKNQVNSIDNIDSVAKKTSEQSKVELTFMEKAKAVSAKKYNEAKKYAVTVSHITVEKANELSKTVKDKYKNTVIKYKIDSNSSRGKIISELKRSEDCFALADTDSKFEDCKLQLAKIAEEK